LDIDWVWLDGIQWQGNQRFNRCFIKRNIQWNMLLKTTKEVLNFLEQWNGGCIDDELDSSSNSECNAKKFDLCHKLNTEEDA